MIFMVIDMLIGCDRDLICLKLKGFVEIQYYLNLN